MLLGLAQGTLYKMLMVRKDLHVYSCLHIYTKLEVSMSLIIHLCL